MDDELKNVVIWQAKEIISLREQLEQMTRWWAERSARADELEKRLKEPATQETSSNPQND